MTDHELYQLCKKYGEMTLSARRKFAGLLPEVLRRRLYEKKGYSSIFEFAARLAGMSREHVNLVLNLERRFEDKQVLQKALVSGEVSASKLARIISIATVENQEDLFGIVKTFSNKAVETFVRDVKRGNASAGVSAGVQNDTQTTVIFQDQNGLGRPLFDAKGLRAQTLKLDTDVEKELFEMQEKGIDVNRFLREAMMKRKEEIETKKEEIAKVGKDEKQEIDKSVSRYVPAAVRKIINEEHGTKCSYPGCGKHAKILHHTGRFALMRSHDPRYIAPLCAEHHEIAHKIDLKYAEKVVV